MNGMKILEKYKNSFPVHELRKMFGIGKTESYWILKHKDIQTVTINGKIRVLKNSFWEWYSNQTKYHILDGPEPGEKLKTTSHSARDIMALLDVSKYIAYTLMAQPVFDRITVDDQIRITKESFDRWYPTQNKYRLEEDRAADSKIIAETYSMPEIGRMLGVHRNTVYYILNHPDNQIVFEFVETAGQKRVTISSFERWYASQNRYKVAEPSPNNAHDVVDIDVDTAPVLSELREAEPCSQKSNTSKDTFRLEDLMADLGISRKSAYKLIQTGELIAIKAGKSYIIPASEYKRYIEGRTNNGIHHSEE